MEKSYELKNPIELNIEKLKKVKPILSFDKDKSFVEQRKIIKEKFSEIVRVRKTTEKPNIIIEYKDTSDERFDEIRFLAEVENDFFVPAHFLIPKNFSGKIPVVICLQGHSTGMHVSLAREMHPGKAPIQVEGDRDFCIQAVKRGYAALAIEQRGFGELNPTDKEFICHELAWQYAMMGENLIGQRVGDILAFIDVLEEFDFADTNRIGIMGNSGGGTSSYFAACSDERIKVCMPSSTFCTFSAAWGSLYHCDCGYVPGLLKYMEMPDMALMIAPRPLILVNGIYDHIQPFESAKKAYETVKEIYKLSGSPDNCQMVVGDEGHRFYADIAWDVFDKYI